MLSRTKKVLLIIGLIFVFIRIGYIFIGKEVSKSAYTVCHVDINNAKKEKCNNISAGISLDEKYLKAILLKFSNKDNTKESLDKTSGGKTDENKGYLLIKIKNDNKTVYETKIHNSNIVNNEWKRIHVNMPVDKKANYKLTIKAKDLENVPKVYMVKDELAIQYEYIAKPSVISQLVAILVCIVLYILYVLVVLKYRFIEEVIDKFVFWVNNLKISKFILPLWQVLLGFVIIHFSHMNLNNVTMVLFVLVSLLFGLKNDKRESLVKEKVNSIGKKTFFYFICIYGAFALVGYNIWLFPLNKWVTLKQTVLFLLAVIWFVPVVKGCLSICFGNNVKGIKEKDKNEEISKVTFLDGKWVILLWAAVLIIPSIIGLIAFNPGITSADTTSTLLENAHNIKGMVDWHPAFYCIVLRLIIGIWDSTYAVIIVQYILWLFVTLEMLLFLRKKGLNSKILLLSAIFMGTNVANILHINTIWKDVPYGLVLLWSAVILAKLALDYNLYKNKWFIYGELVVALVNLYFLRKNGMVPVIIIAVVLLVLFRKSKKIIGSLGITVAIILLISGPIYDFLDIKSTGKHGMYIGLSQDILGVYYAGGEVSQETLDMINVMTYGSNGEYYYIPTWSYQSYDLDVSTVEFIFNYLDTFVRNPVIMVRTIISREDVVWNIFKGQDAFLNCVNYITTEDGVGQWNNYYPKRVNNILTEKMTEFTTYTSETQWIASVYWRCGIWTFLSLIVLFSMYLKYGMKKYMIIMAPGVGNFLGLLLSTGWSDFRYFWPINLVNVFVILIGFINLDVKDY